MHLLGSLSDDAEAPRRAFIHVSRGLGDALYANQQKPSPDADLIKVLELLLRRVLAASRINNNDEKLVVREEIREAIRAFAMTLLHHAANKKKQTGSLRYVALLFDALWRETTFRDDVDVLLWCLNAANTALVDAVFSKKKPDWNALMTLGPYFDTFVALLKKGHRNFGQCKVAALMTIQLFILATPPDAKEVTTKNPTWRRGLCKRTYVAAVTMALDALAVSPIVVDDNVATDVQCTMTCWTLAALLRSRVSQIPLPVHLTEMIRLRMQEVLASRLGLLCRSANNAASAALVRLVALDDGGQMAVWYSFTARWLLHQGPALPPYAALCIAALMNPDLRKDIVELDLPAHLRDTADSTDADQTSALLHLLTVAAVGSDPSALRIAIDTAASLEAPPVRRFLNGSHQSRRSLDWYAFGDIFLPTHPPAFFPASDPPSSGIVYEPHHVDVAGDADILRASGAAAAAILASSSSSRTSPKPSSFLPSACTK